MKPRIAEPCRITGPGAPLSSRCYTHDSPAEPGIAGGLCALATAADALLRLLAEDVDVRDGADRTEAEAHAERAVARLTRLGVLRAW